MVLRCLQSASSGLGGLLEYKLRRGTVTWPYSALTVGQTWLLEAFYQHISYIDCLLSSVENCSWLSYFYGKKAGGGGREDRLLCTWMKLPPNGGSGQIVSNKYDESFTVDQESRRKQGFVWLAEP